MHISFHVVSISRDGLYAHPLFQAPSVAGGNKSRPYEKNEDDTAVIVALCIEAIGKEPSTGANLISHIPHQASKCFVLRIYRAKGEKLQHLYRLLPESRCLPRRSLG
jgi:hypothetical protein